MEVKTSLLKWIRVFSNLWRVLIAENGKCRRISIELIVGFTPEATLVWSNHLIQLHLKQPCRKNVGKVYIYYFKYKLSIIFRAKNYLCVSQSWLLVTKAKTLRPLRRKRVFCSFVFIIRDFISKGLNPERDAYVLCFRRVLSSGTKNNNNKRHLLYFSRMAQQRAFRQRNRRRACTWPL